MNQKHKTTTQEITHKADEMAMKTAAAATLILQDYQHSQSSGRL